MLPHDIKTEVDKSGREIPVRPFVFRAQVEGHTEAIIPICAHLRARNIFVASIPFVLRLYVRPLTEAYMSAFVRAVQLIFTKGEVGPVEISIDIARTDKEFDGSAHTQTFHLLYLPGMVECHLGISIGMRTQVADVIGLVGHTFFSKRRKPRMPAPTLATAFMPTVLYPPKALNPALSMFSFVFAWNPVVVVEFAHGFGNAHAWVGEQHRAAVKVIEHSRRMEVAASGYVDISLRPGKPT